MSNLEPYIDQNPYFLPIKQTDRRYVLSYGGSGGGKSVFVAQMLVEDCMRDPRHNILLGRKVQKDVRDSSFSQIRTILKALGLENEENYKKSICNIRRQEMRIKFPTGAQMLGIGLDKRGRLKSIDDPTKIWMEEANQISYEDFNELDRRLRGSNLPDFQIILTFNPNIPKAHWIRRCFFSEKDNDMKIDEDKFLIHKSTVKDNIFGDKEYIETLQRLPEKERKVYLSGDFYDIQEPDQLIADKYVEEAFQRDPKGHYGERRLGIDAARFGDDKITFAEMDGMVLLGIDSVGNERTTETASRALMRMDESNISEDYVALDVVGLGAGAADHMYENGVEVTDFIAGASPVEDKSYRQSFFNFKNLRSQAWYYMKTLLENGKIVFDIDPDSSEAQRLREDLTAPKYRVVGDKELVVEPKQSSKTAGTEEGRKDWGLKERLGRSTDEADAVIEAAFVHRLTNTTDYTVV